MSILLNSTHAEQPWWDYDKTVWEDITPQRPLHQDKYFGDKGWEYSSADTAWPSSELIRGFVGSFGDSETLTIEGEFPMWTADVEIVSRALDLSGKFPAWTSDVHILTGEILTIAGEVPKWTGTIVIPSEHIIIAGKFPRWSSDVEILSGDIISIEGKFPNWTSNITILCENIVSIEGRFPRWNSNIRIISGEIATISGNIPRWTSSVIITPNVGAFVLIGIFPSWKGIIDIRQEVKVYAATVMNVSNFSVTEYSQYPISSIGYMNDHYYGTLSDGIYLLEGNDDSGTNIDAEIETGPIDLWEGSVKYPKEAYISFRSDGTIILRIRLDEQDTYESELSYLSERMREGKVTFGKGIKNRFAAFGIKNKDGSDLDIDKIRITLEPVRRKR